VKNEVLRIDKTLSEISEKISEYLAGDNKSDNARIAMLEAEIKRLQSESSDLSEKMEKVYEWSDTISSDHNWLVQYAENIAEDHNKLISYSEMIGERQNSLVEYAEAIAEDHNHLASYSEKIAEDHNHLANYTEKIAEDHNYVAAYVDEKLRPLLESTINYAEMVAEKANQGLNYVQDVIVSEIEHTQQYSNMLGEKLNTVWNYSEYLGEKSNEMMSYAAYLGENACSIEDMESVIGYTEHIAESVNSRGLGIKMNESDTKVTNKYNTLNEKIDTLLHTIKTEKVNESVIGNLNYEQKLKFGSFSPTQKEQVISMVNETMSPQEVSRIFESVANPVPPADAWLQTMPEDIKPLWENASPGVKEKIMRNVQLYNLSNPYAIKHYWASKVQMLAEGATTQNINESVNAELNETKVHNLGYGSDFVKNVFAGW